MPTRNRTKIDRAKVRAAIRKLGDEYVFYMLDAAIDLLSDEQLGALVTKYVRRDGFALDEGETDLFASVKEFERASLAGEFYEAFNVNSKNYMDTSKGTRAWIAECRRLFDRLVDSGDQAIAFSRRSRSCFRSSARSTSARRTSSSSPMKRARGRWA